MNVFRPSVLFAALASISFVTAQEPVKGAGKVETQAPAAEAEWMQNFADAKAKVDAAVDEAWVASRPAAT